MVSFKRRITKLTLTLATAFSCSLGATVAEAGLIPWAYNAVFGYGPIFQNSQRRIFAVNTGPDYGYQQGFGGYQVGYGGSPYVTNYGGIYDSGSAWGAGYSGYGYSNYGLDYGSGYQDAYQMSGYGVNQCDPCQTGASYQSNYGYAPPLGQIYLNPSIYNDCQTGNAPPIQQGPQADPGQQNYRKVDPTSKDPRTPPPDEFTPATPNRNPQPNSPLNNPGNSNSNPQAPSNFPPSTIPSATGAPDFGTPIPGGGTGGQGGSGLAPIHDGASPAPAPFNPNPGGMPPGNNEPSTIPGGSSLNSPSDLINPAHRPEGGTPTFRPDSSIPPQNETPINSFPDPFEAPVQSNRTETPADSHGTLKIPMDLNRPADLPAVDSETAPAMPESSTEPSAAAPTATTPPAASPAATESVPEEKSDTKVLKPAVDPADVADDFHPILSPAGERPTLEMPETTPAAPAQESTGSTPAATDSKEKPKVEESVTPGQSPSQTPSQVPAPSQNPMESTIPEASSDSVPAETKVLPSVDTVVAYSQDVKITRQRVVLGTPQAAMPTVLRVQMSSNFAAPATSPAKVAKN